MTDSALSNDEQVNPLKGSRQRPEIGHYARCIEYINQARKFYGDDTVPFKNKLAPRLVKSYMQLSNSEAAESDGANA